MQHIILCSYPYFDPSHQSMIFFPLIVSYQQGQQQVHEINRVQHKQKQVSKREHKATQLRTTQLRTPQEWCEF